MPFVKLSFVDSIAMGPVLFWKASKFQNFIPTNLQNDFQEYIQWAGTFQAIDDQRNQINTERINPDSITCISVDQSITNNNQINELVIDAMYLLHFSYNYSWIKMGSPRELNPFLKIWNAEEGYISGRQWQGFHHYEYQKESHGDIGNIADFLVTACGQLLQNKYFHKGQARIFALRMTRAAQYFSRRFYDKFKEPLTRYASEPEDIVFMATAFEALFDINETYQRIRKVNPNYSTRQALKEKLGKCLNLGNKKPVKVFNDWVDGFYDLRNEIVHGKSPTKYIFDGNPNYKVSYIMLAVELFLFSIFMEFDKRKYFGPPSRLSHLIVKSSVLHYFWKQNELLLEILDDLVILKRSKGRKNYLRAMVKLNHDQHVYGDSYGQQILSNLRFTTSNLNQSKKIADQIRRIFDFEKKIGNQTKKLRDCWISKSNNLSATDRFLDDLQRAGL